MTQYTSNVKRFCSVYKSSKKAEMYLYVDRKFDLDSLPDSLKAAFGEPLHVMDLVLTPEKKLARVKATQVLEAIESQDFFLQMPPTGLVDVAGQQQAPKDSLHG